MVCTICSVAHQQWWLISHFSLFFFFTLFDFSFLFLFLTYTKVAARFCRPGSFIFRSCWRERGARVISTDVNWFHVSRLQPSGLFTRAAPADENAESWARRNRGVERVSGCRWPTRQIYGHPQHMRSALWQVASEAGRRLDTSSAGENSLKSIRVFVRLTLPTEMEGRSD